MNLTNKQKRKLDAIIAERVEGWEYYTNPQGASGWYKTNPRVGYGISAVDLPHYTTDIAAAFGLVNRGDIEIPNCQLVIQKLPRKNAGYRVLYGLIDSPIEYIGSTIKETVALVILKATVGNEEFDKIMEVL